MEAAQKAVSSFLGRTGQHDTRVDETVAPGVTTETIKPHRHEQTTTAVDREVHQHHYHTTVQPLNYQETLPERHSHSVMPIEHREFRHNDEAATKQRLSDEAAKFQNQTTTARTTHTRSALPEQAGEHVHHYVHETVQPVVYKDTIRPEIVHTTIPVHEMHHAPSEHHGISQLPAKSFDEFRAAGGDIRGSQGTIHHEQYSGHPRPYSKQMQLEQHPVDLEPHKHWGTHDLEATGHPPLKQRTAGAIAGHGPGHQGQGQVQNQGLQGQGQMLQGQGQGLQGQPQGSHGQTIQGQGQGLQGQGQILQGQGGQAPHGYGQGLQGQPPQGMAQTRNVGPHDSNLANRLDPRVDNNQRLGAGSAGMAATGAGVGAAAGGAGGYGSQTTGPHNSNILNRLDPRVDSDRDGRGIGAGVNQGGMNTGIGQGQMGPGGQGSSTTGPHRSDLLNRLDPRVDSSQNNQSSGAGYGAGQATHGAPTTGQSTTGPHRSDMMNRLDPRVDSDQHRGMGAGGAGLTGAGAGAAVTGLASQHQHQHQHQGVSGNQNQGQGWPLGGNQPGLQTSPGTGNLSQNMDRLRMDDRNQQQNIGNQSYNTSENIRRVDTAGSGGSPVNPQQYSRMTDSGVFDTTRGAGDEFHDAKENVGGVRRSSGGESSLSGKAEPGSHSAVFGLTPDGQVHDDTSQATSTQLRPAHSKETSIGNRSHAEQAVEAIMAEHGPTMARDSGGSTGLGGRPLASAAPGVMGEAPAGDKAGSGSMGTTMNPLTGASRGGGNVNMPRESESTGGRSSSGGFGARVAGMVQNVLGSDRHSGTGS